MSTPTGFFFKIRDQGQERRVRLYATTSDWSRDILLSSEETSLTLVGNQQVRFTTENNQDYIRHALLNQKVSYRIDISHVRKDWNSAVYTVDTSGLRVPQYGDAQTRPPRIEMDIQEANKHAFRYTAHKPYDRNGSLIMGLGGTIQQNTAQLFRSDQVPFPASDLYGVGKYIDTNLPFWVTVTHSGERVRLELEQDGRRIFQETSSPNYLSSCRLDQEQHTFILSLWTGSMWWLDGGLPNYPENDRYPTIQVTISDFSIEHYESVSGAFSTNR